MVRVTAAFGCARASGSRPARADREASPPRGLLGSVRRNYDREPPWCSVSSGLMYTLLMNFVSPVVGFAFPADSTGGREILRHALCVAASGQAVSTPAAKMASPTSKGI